MPKRSIASLFGRMPSSTGAASHVYLIALNRRSGGHVEIFRLNELVKQFAPERDLVIAGIAESYERARELLVEILEEAIARTGSADTAAYLSEHEGKELVTVRE